MITLALEASTYVGSVCVVRGRDEVVASRTVAMRDARHELLMPAVASALDQAGVAVDDVTRIVCGAGPGSFTSLRISAAIGKGLATATGRPLHGVSSLALMIAASEPPLHPGEYVAVLDALRAEAYAAPCVVGESGEVTDVGPVALVGADELGEMARLGRQLVGPGQRIKGAPHARGIVRVARLLERSGPVDLAAWEPAYGRVAEAQRRWEAVHGQPLPRA